MIDQERFAQPLSSVFVQTDIYSQLFRKVFSVGLYSESVLAGCVNEQMEQCERVGKTERILGISLVFGSTLPFSSPNSPYSSARTIRCSYCCNEPKEMGDQLQHPSHKTPQKMF